MVRDDGVGLGTARSVTAGSGLGQLLVRSMAEQPRGTYEIERAEDQPGTIATVRFPDGQ